MANYLGIELDSIESGGISLPEDKKQDSGREYMGIKLDPIGSESSKNVSESSTILGEIPKGLKAGVQQLRGMGYGVGAIAGEATGIEPIKEWAKEGLEDVEAKTPKPAVGSFADIESVSDVGKYLAYGVATNLPNMLLSFTGGGLGAVLGKGLVGSAAKSAITKAAEKAIIEQGIKRGALAGAGLSSIGMEAGMIAGDQLTETGKVEPLRAMAGAIPAGILDVIPEWYLAKRLGWLGKDVAKFEGNRAVRALKVAGQQFSMEAPTEAMQSVIERASVPGKTVTNAEAWNEYIDSFILGGATGGVMGGVGGVFTKRVERVNPVIEQLKADPLEKQRQALEDEVTEGDPELKAAIEVPPIGQPGVPPVPLTEPPPVGGPEPPIIPPAMPPAAPPAIEPPIPPPGVPAVAPIVPETPVTPIQPEKRMAEREPTDIWSVEKRLQMDTERFGPRYAPSPAGGVQPAATLGGKQPWEMTREEFSATHYVRGRNATMPEEGQAAWAGNTMGDFGRSYANIHSQGEGGEIRVYKNSNILSKDFSSVLSPDRPPVITYTRKAKPDYITPGAIDPHRFLVEQALSEGKPVSPEVLKDYPELSPSPLPEAGKVAEVSPVEAGVPTLEEYITSKGMDVADLPIDVNDKNKWPDTRLKQYPITKEVINYRKIYPIPAELKAKIAEGKAQKQTFQEFLKGKGINQNIGNEASRFYDATQHKKLLAEWKGEKAPISPVTKAAETTVTTPKEQKTYVLGKVDKLITAARERWRAENRNPNPTEAQKEALAKYTDKDLDEDVLKGRFASETPPTGAETVTIEVPNDGTFKIPNTLRGLLTFQRNMKRMETRTTPSEGYIPAPSPINEKKYLPGEQAPRREISRNLPSNKPTGKTAAQFEAEYETETKAEADRITQARESAKSNYLYLKDKAIPEADADQTKWEAIHNDVDDGKRTLKSLAQEFHGKVPSGKELYARRSDRRATAIRLREDLRVAEENIRTNYPSLAKEMFGETKGETENGDITERESNGLTTPSTSLPVGGNIVSSKTMAAEIVKPEEAKFLTITEKQTVTNTKGNEITLEANEPYRIEHNDDGTVTLVDGKEVKTTIKELKDIKGDFSNEPNIAAGGISAEQRRTYPLSNALKRTIGTLTSTFTDNPQNLPQSLSKTLDQNFKTMNQDILRGYDAAFSNPFHMSQKYKGKAPDDMWRIHGIERVEKRGDLRTEHLNYAKDFLEIDDLLKNDRLNSKQRKEAKSRVVRMFFATDIILHDELVALKESAQGKRGQEFNDIQAKINEITKLRRFSDTRLREGIVDEYGNTIKLNSETEIKAYVAARHSMDKMMEAKIDWLHTIAFRKWKNQKWYNLLLQAAGVDLSKETVQVLVGKKGLNAAAINYSKTIKVDIGKIFDRIEEKITTTPPGEISAVGEKYDKLATKVSEELLKFQEYVGKITDIKDPAELTKLTRKVFAAYVQTRPYLQKIKTLRNQMNEWVGYAPRYREQGEFKLRYVEEVLDPETGLIEEREKYMEMFNSKREYQNLYVKFLNKFADKDGNLPANHVIRDEKIGISPESAFQGVNDVNVQKIIDDAISNMALETTYIDKKTGETVDLHEALKDAAYQSIANQFMMRGAGKTAIHRNQKYGVIKGYEEENLDRVLINYISSMTGMMTKQQAAADAMEILRDTTDRSMFEGMSKYNREMLRNESRGDRISGGIKSLIFLWYLGGVMRPVVVNLTQNPVVGFPELAKYMREHKVGGVGTADMAYAKAMKDVLFNKTDELENYLQQQMVTKGHAQDLFIQSIFEGLKGKVGQKTYQMMRVMATPFSRIEIYNRKSAAVAMFRTAYPMYVKQGLAPGKDGAAYQAAFADARTFIGNVHYEYGKTNFPLPMQSGDILSTGLKTGYVFRGFTHNFLIRQFTLLAQGDIKTTLHTMAYIALFGGLMGLPFFKDFFEWAEKEFGFSAKKYIRHSLRGVGGETLETFGMHGLPAVLGANLSGSLAIGLPWPIGAATPEDTIFGVYGGMVQKGKRALESVSAGDFERASSEMLPEALRSPIVAMRESEFGRDMFGYPGYATTQRGRPMLDEQGKPISIKGSEVALKALGFNPTERAREAEMNQTIKRQEAWYADKVANIGETFRVARIKENPKALANLVKDIAELREKIKNRGIENLVPRPTVSKIIQSSRQVRGKQQIREQRYKRTEL